MQKSMKAQTKAHLYKRVNELKSEIAQKRKERLEGLPHLYGFKWYRWAKAFFECMNKMCLLLAPNQCSKSSTQIRKVIHWATEDKLWTKLWATRPRIFWYLYPSKEVATVEFETKWLPEFMPRGKFKDDKKYGWDVEYDGKYVSCIHFNSGVNVYFKTYAQDVSKLQTASVHLIATDEELPEELYSELMARLTATNGYFSMVFTATLNQEMWYRAMEGKGQAELFPNAFKQQISLYDCQLYQDGTPSQWTDERIKEVIASCKSDIEVQRRVFGKFVTEEGRVYGAYDANKHFISPYPIPQDWAIFSGVDLGTGGDQNHPAAICFLAVRPDYRYGIIFRGWRGDKVITTAGDVLEKYRELRGNLKLTFQKYDWHAKDFGILAERAGEGFTKAEKSHELGESTINTLFRHSMLAVFDDPELSKLSGEFTTLLRSTPKTKARDDFADASRYAIMSVPWDWSGIKDYVGEEVEKETRALTPEEYVAWEIRVRRGEETIRDDFEEVEFQDEIDEWNEAYGN